MEKDCFLFLLRLASGQKGARQSPTAPAEQRCRWSSDSLRGQLEFESMLSSDGSKVLIEPAV